MSTQDDYYDDQLMDALLHEQSRDDREQVIHEVENAIMADVVSHVIEQPIVDWKRLVASIAIAAVVVLGLGTGLSFLLRPGAVEPTGSYQYFTFTYLTEESAQELPNSRPVAKHTNRRPTAPGASREEIASMRAGQTEPGFEIPSNPRDQQPDPRLAAKDPVTPPAGIPDAAPRRVLLVDQVWQDPFQKPLSMVSVDVDNTSYSQIQRLIEANSPIPKHAVRIEECINAFDYAYKAPKGDKAFAVHTDLMTCPWNEPNMLLKVGIKAREMAGDFTPATIAKDVLFQIEFNPQRVQSYRLIGYADAITTSGDLHHNPAGEIEAGHSMTAFYEIVPVRKTQPKQKDSGLKYQKPSDLLLGAGPSDEWLTLKLHHRHPEDDTISLMETVLKGKATPWAKASTDARFAASVALFGMKLRNMDDVASATWDQVLNLARPGLKNDPDGKRAAFIAMVMELQALSR